MLRKMCGSCAVLDPNAQTCRLTRVKKNPNSDFCSDYTDRLEKCGLCGAIMLPKDAIITYNSNDEVRLICQKCVDLISTCQVCANAANCSFETDPSALPKVVMKTVRQGNMVAQTQARNPDREAITCKVGCKCYDSELGCRREYSYCQNYTETAW